MGLFSSSSKSTTKVKPYDKKRFRNLVNEMYDLTDVPLEMYQDQMYAGMDPLQQESLQMREQYARQGGGVVDPALGAWQSQLQSPDVANNPYVQAMLEQNATNVNRNLTENLIPSIDAQAIGAGQMGSSRQGVAEGIAMRGTQEALADANAATQLGAYGQGLADRQGAMSNMGSMYGLGMAPAQELGAVGGTLRGEEQLAIDEDMARFQFDQDELFNRLNRSGGQYLDWTSPYKTTTSKTSSSPSIGSQIGQLGGMAIGGYGMGQSAGLWGGGGGGMGSGFNYGSGAPSYGGYGIGMFG